MSAVLLFPGMFRRLPHAPSAGGNISISHGVRRFAFRAVLFLAAVLVGLGSASAVHAADDPEELYRDGEALVAQKKPAAAEAVFEQLVRIAPQHLRGKLALARIQIDRSPETALATLDAARVLDPNSEEVYWLRGRALETLGRLPEAADAYRQVIRINPRRVEVNQRLRFVLRILRSQQTRVQEAAERFYASPNLATLSLFGRMLLDETPSFQALAELEDARQRVPQLPEINLWIARVQKKAGSVDGEIDAYQRFLAADEKAAGVRLLLAERLEEAGRTRSAYDVAGGFDRDEKLLQGLDPHERARLAYIRSGISMSRVELGHAADYLSEAARLGLDPALLRATYLSDLTLQPDEPDFWQGYAEWLTRTRDLDAAVDAWLQAGLLDPKMRPASRGALEALDKPGLAPDSARLGLARLALADGQPAEALKLAEPLPAAPALRKTRLLVLGLAYRAMGDSKQSVDAFTRYVVFAPEAKEIARARGMLQWELGDRGAAVAAWQEHPEALEGNPELLARIAQYLQSSGDDAKEQVFREELARLSGVTPSNRIRLGDLYLAKGRSRDALAQWDAALAQDPHDFDLLIRVARLRYSLGDMTGGTARLLQANNLRPVPIDLALILADTWRTQGRLGEALALYWQVYQVRPQEPKLRIAFPDVAANVAVEPQMRRVAAEMALETNRPQLAIALLQRLLQEQPGDMESRALLAEVYESQGQAAEAGALLKAANPPITAADHLRLLAKVQRETGNSAGLVVTLGKLGELESGNPVLARERGILLVQLGRMDEADPVLAPLAAGAHGDPELQLALAHVDLAKNRQDSAEARLKDVLASKPDLAEAHRLLQQMYLRQRRWEEYGKELEYQIARDPRSPQLREATIAAYLRAFRAPLARPHYEALRTLDPQRAQALSSYFPE